MARGGGIKAEGLGKCKALKGRREEQNGRRNSKAGSETEVRDPGKRVRTGLEELSRPRPPCCVWGMREHPV